MIKSILIVSNENTFNGATEDKIDDIFTSIIESGKEVHIFREDLLLYEKYKNTKGVKYIKGLSSGADVIIFNRINYMHYDKEDTILEHKGDFGEIYKKAISRHKTPNKEKAFDETEYNLMRESIMYRRLRFNISNIANEYKFVINFKDVKDVNLLNSLKPEFGDGKFIYIYDCVKEIGDFLVGGCSLPADNFEACIQGY